MTALISLLAFLVLLTIVVLVHEGGHFLAAKWAGVYVDRFSLGMGKVLFARKIGETEFAVSMLPLGGYVRMVGEGGYEVDGVPPARWYTSASRFKRFVILAAGPVMNFVLAAVCLAILGAIGTPDIAPTVGEPPAKSAAALAGIRAGDTPVSIAGVEIRGYGDIADALVSAKGRPSIPVVVKRDGGNVTLSLSTESIDWETVAKKPAAIVAGFFPLMGKDLTVLSVVANGAAAKAGLPEGAKVLLVNGVKPESPEAFVAAVRRSGEKAVALTVKTAGGEEKTYSIVPQKDAAGVPKIGVYAAGDFKRIVVRYGPVEAIGHGIARMWRITKLEVQGIGAIATGELGVENVSGPVGIATMSGKAALAGASVFVEFVALISVAIGVMNLLPIPGLDGGHMAILLIEAAMRRNFGEKTKLRLVQAGMFIVLCLIVLAVNNDIARLLN